ncbi:hypothetical protein K469DRAFT_157999 [Zopfia rhizophila CBS 207.26]|uniref:F-box domain-containing protein n=1 Tax=Zopfia rhizophila CBS 207.26 TaxID=1314779 RepID=A0A6A6E551_9PEZI|nr:hypothetical protein K469DRAFT_157999 [Zopfia rhizophila CBS 207.26]
MLNYLKYSSNRTCSASQLQTWEARAEVPTFKLPIDLLLLICDILPLSAQTRLAPICRRLYSILGPSVVQKLNNNSFESETQKSYLLRQLRKDLVNSNTWIRYKCIRSHPPRRPCPFPTTYLTTEPRTTVKLASLIVNQGTRSGIMLSISACLIR